MGKLFTQGWYDRVEALIALLQGKIAATAAGSSTGAATVWTDVPAGTVVAFSPAQSALSFDSTPAATQSALNLPAAAAIVDGQEFTARLTGAAVSPVLLHAGAGTQIEGVNAQASAGTFGASTYLPNQGHVVTFKYDHATTLWKAKAVSYGSPIAAQQQTTWAVSRPGQVPAGLDSNPGTALAPLASAAELRRRWNGGIAGVRPQMPGLTYAITVNGSVAAGHEFEDPLDVLWDLDAGLGLLMTISLTPTVKRAGTILAVPNPFSRTATGEQTVTDAGVADWTSDVDHLLAITNSPKKSVCWVSRALAGPARGVLTSVYDSAESSPPFSSILNGGLAADTVAPADTYDILNLATCYFGNSSQFRMKGGKDTGTAGQAAVIVLNAHGLAQSGHDLLHVEGDAIFPFLNLDGACVSFVNCRIDQTRDVQQGGVYWLNCFYSNGAHEADQLAGPQETGAQLSGYGRRGVLLTDNWAVDQDYFSLDGFTIFSGDFGGGAFGPSIGQVGYFAHGHVSTQILGLEQGAWMNILSFFSAAPVVYGDTGGAGNLVSMAPGSTLKSVRQANVSLVTDQAGAGAFGVDGFKGVFWNAATSTYLPVGGVTVTVTSIDAAHPGGFAGLCHVLDTNAHIVFVPGI